MDADISGFLLKADPQTGADIVKPFLNEVFSFPASTNEGIYTIPMPTPLSGILAIKDEKSAPNSNDVLLSKH